MPNPRKPSQRLRVDKATIAHLRWMAKTLESRYGIVDKKERREIISDLERQRWIEKQKSWSKKVFSRGGSASFRREMYRALNKMLVLTERFEKAATSIKRRNILANMRTILLPKPEVMAKFSIKERLNIDAVRGYVGDSLINRYTNKTTPAAEKIEIIRTLVHIYPLEYRRIIIELFERHPPERPVRNEMIRWLSQTMSATFPEFIRNRFIESKDLDAKIFGIEVLSHCPSIFALTTLAGIVKPKTLETSTVKEGLTLKGRKEIQRILQDKSLLEHAVEDAQKILKQMSDRLTKAEQMEVSFYVGTFIIGFASKGIRVWLTKHGKQLPSRDILVDILSSLTKQRNELSKLQVKHKAVSYAIKEIEQTIDTLQKYI
ncbi:MAG: hypothetical protein QXM75_00785 [Candidatus Diapherotrites archaeon]